MVVPTIAKLTMPLASDLPREVQALLAAHGRVTAELQRVRAENAELKAAMAKGLRHSLGGELNGDIDGRQEQGIYSPDEAEKVSSGSSSARDSSESCDGQEHAGVHEQSVLAAVSALPQPGGPAASTRQESLFTGGVRRLAVIDEFAVTVELFVHQSIIRKLPYFEARSDRWGSSDAEELHLPSCCTHAGFSAVLCRLYSLDSHWSPADWIRALGEDLAQAYGTLLLLKMLLATNLVDEVVSLVRQLAVDAASVAWLQRVAGGLDVPELDGFCAASGSVVLDTAALKQATLSAMKGSAEGRLLLEDVLAKREAEGLAEGDAEALICVLRDHDSYTVQSCTHSLASARPRRAAAFCAAGSHRAVACDFFRPFRVPLESFSWLWQLVRDSVQKGPGLFQTTLAAFRALQWLEYDVSANRHGQESAAGSRRLRHLPEAGAKQGIRRAYASYLLLGLSLLDRGHIDEDAFIEAFTCGALSPAQAPEGLTGRRRNILHFQSSAQRPSSNYVDRMDVVAMVFSSVSDALRASLLSLVPSFSEWQWAFSAVAVGSLSDEQQLACARGCTLSWLSAKVCTALRGEARSVARSRLTTQVGSLSAGQQNFVRANFAGAA
mmetsp:Transcript_96305/g.296960  ORF Transcript_96305/g.296960 Transcript_96305/m.296960 type:complete len:609 (-) Transcript_96305:458-2284(-)